MYVKLPDTLTLNTYYGGWHSGATGDDGFLSHVCHSGDGESHTGWRERFEHPTKTWACATRTKAVHHAGGGGGNSEGHVGVGPREERVDKRGGDERGVGGEARRIGRRS
jgi:hypothetical protein